MTNIDQSVANSFIIGSTYFPIIEDANIVANSITGAIDVIKILDQGRNYNNYIDGAFRSIDIFVNGEKLLFNIANNICSSVNGFYTGCLLYISSGILQGQYRLITDYQSNTTGNIITIESEFDADPQNSDEFEIRPYVNVYGDGTQTVNCVARALINATASNAVFNIEILETGQGYKYPSANIVANDVVNISNTCTIRPINGPAHGHGSDIFNELYCKNYVISVTLSNTENGTIPSTNYFQQIGLLKNPLFSNVVLNFGLLVGSFVQNETLYKFEPLKLAVNCSTTIANTIIMGNGTFFSEQISNNDYLYITTSTVAYNQLVQVESVINNIAINLQSNAMFNSSDVYLYKANLVSNCICTDIISGNTISVTNVSPYFTAVSLIIGAESGAFGITNSINSIIRNDVIKDYNTFIQMYKYNMTITDGTFIEGEKILQGNNFGYLHSISGNPSAILYINMFNDGPLSNGNITGDISGATGTITNRYDPELIFGSGKVLYTENIEAVTRQTDQNENIQIVLNI